ncbi:MAG: MinD/ParA family protein [Bacillota bacterium]
MKDQASRLREIASLNKDGNKSNISSIKVLAVVSGKGGVGKTNISLNLAIALAKRDKKVLVFDADLGMANIDILMGIVPKYTLYDALKGTVSLQDIVAEGPLGIKIIPGGSGVGELTQIDFQQREYIWDQLRKYFIGLDYVLIDCGAGINRSIVGFMVAADEVVVVLTPEPTSITDAYSVIKILSKFQINSEVFLIVNRVNNLEEAQSTARKIETVSQRFLNIKIKRLGFISNDEVIERAVRKQVPFTVLYPNSKASMDMEQLAENLIEGKMRPPKGVDSFMGRLLKLFG